MRMRTIVWIAALAIAASAAAGPARAQQVYELKVSTFTPPTDFINRDMQAWAEDLKTKSNGRLILKIFPTSQMGPPPRQFDLARTGVADIAVMLHGLTPGRFPMTELSHLPGYLPAAEAGAVALTELLPEYLAAEHAGVKVLNFIVASPLPIVAQVDIGKAEDFKGKRIRAAGTTQSAVIEAMGAVPVLIQPGEMNDALGKGMVDAVSVGYSGASAFKLADVAKFVTEIDLGAVTFATIMNPDSYEKLPPDLRKLIDETSGVAGSKRLAKAISASEASGKEALAKAGLKFNSIPSGHPLVLEATTKIAEPAIAKLGAKSEAARDFLAKLKAKVSAYKPTN